MGLDPASYEQGDDFDTSGLLFGADEHEEQCFELPTRDGPPVRQLVNGWRQGACDIVWSKVLPEVVALNRHLLVGRSVLELGAGCGLVGLVASQTASHVLITDGDLAEVRLIASNAEAYAPNANVRAAHLAWGAAATRRAQEAGTLGCPPVFDVVLAAQVVYVPACIPALVETFAACLAPGGEVWLYNEAVSVMSSQRECRADLDAALASHGFVVAEGTRSGLALPAYFGDLPTHAYLLRLTRPTSP